MPMGVWHAQPADGVALEVELDYHNRLLADHPPIVAGFDRHNLRRLELDDASVAVLDVNLAPHQEPDVGVHTEVGADDRFHVFRPVESRRIDHSLHSAFAGAPDFQTNVTDLSPIGTSDRRQDRIGGLFRRGFTWLR
jgi:hypothetical protein